MVLQLKAILSSCDQLYGRKLSATEIEGLLLFYQLVKEWNDLLHLTTITQPLDFAERHIFESIFTESHLLTEVRKVWDFGSGLGIPGIPIALLRSDLSVVLVEANKKKAIFLKEVASRLQLANLNILNQRFESIADLEPESCVTVRALDQMNRLIPQILEVGVNCTQFLLLGTPETESTLLESLPLDRILQSFPLPSSQNRLLISLNRST
jgi:16S rRNA (guanine527-N7)-methyltransferase